VSIDQRMLSRWLARIERAIVHLEQRGFPLLEVRDGDPPGCVRIVPDGPRVMLDVRGNVVAEIRERGAPSCERCGMPKPQGIRVYRQCDRTLGGIGMCLYPDGADR
jgi:hypothetical protein